jgi:predicted RNA methylase
MKVSNEVLAVLSIAQAEGCALKLTGTLDRGLYEKTNKVLEAAGGKWNRKAKAHLFEMPAEDAIEQIILTGEITVAQDFGFFPTPAPVVERLIELADVRDEHRFLEPSAGRGNIACAFRDARSVTCYELLPKNVEALRSLGYAWEIAEADFLTVAPAPVYDRIVMNPPFAKQADIQHVMHASRFLAPNGRLVSVMSAGVVFRQDRRSVEFREFVEQRGGRFEDLPEAAFKSSGTMVRTVIVTFPAA